MGARRVGWGRATGASNRGETPRWFAFGASLALIFMATLAPPRQIDKASNAVKENVNGTLDWALEETAESDAQPSNDRIAQGRNEVKSPNHIENWDSFKNIDVSRLVHMFLFVLPVLTASISFSGLSAFTAGILCDGL